MDTLEKIVNDIIEEKIIGNPSTDSINIILEFEVTSGTEEVSTRRNSTNKNLAFEVTSGAEEVSTRRNTSTDNYIWMNPWREIKSICQKTLAPNVIPLKNLKILFPCKLLPLN